MATLNPNVSAITGYIEQHTLPLISKTVLGGNSIKYFNLMTGIKGATMLNILETDPQLQCGKSCGWTDSGNTTFSQAALCVSPLKVNMTFCDKNLLDTWANYDVKVAAGLKNLPFEEDWINNIIDNLHKQIEFKVWHGVLEGDCDCSEGIIGKLASYKNATDMKTTTDYYKKFFDTFALLPDSVKAANDLVAFVGYDVYYKLIQAIMVTSHFHIEDDALNEGFVFPGTSVHVVPCAALSEFTRNGNVYKDNIIIGRQSNFIYGTDLRGDEEKFDLWYSKDNREFRLAIEFTMGSTIVFPDEVEWSASVEGV